MARSNGEVADHLKLVAQLKSLDGENRFAVAAFEEAARKVRAMTRPVGEACLEDAIRIDGLGESTRETIREFLRRGSSARLRALGLRWPVKAMTMTAVAGVGAKTALRLYEEGYRDLGSLTKAAKAGKLDDKLAKAVLVAAAKSFGRVPLAMGESIAKGIVARLQRVPGVREVVIAGSIRRRAETVKDVDVCVLVGDVKRDGPAVMVAFASLGEPVKGGTARSAVRVAGPSCVLQADLWLGEPSHWGALLCHATGPKEHNIRLRALAKRKGLTVNEYGIFKGKKRCGGEKETDLYQILGIPYSDREHRV